MRFYFQHAAPGRRANGIFLVPLLPVTLPLYLKYSCAMPV